MARADARRTTAEFIKTWVQLHNGDYENEEEPTFMPRALEWLQKYPVAHELDKFCKFTGQSRFTQEDDRSRKEFIDAAMALSVDWLNSISPSRAQMTRLKGLLGEEDVFNEFLELCVPVFEFINDAWKGILAQIIEAEYPRTFPQISMYLPAFDAEQKVGQAKTTTVSLSQRPITTPKITLSLDKYKGERGECAPWVASVKRAFRELNLTNDQSVVLVLTHGLVHESSAYNECFNLAYHTGISGHDYADGKIPKLDDIFKQLIRTFDVDGIFLIFEKLVRLRQTGTFAEYRQTVIQLVGLLRTYHDFEIPDAILFYLVQVNMKRVVRQNVVKHEVHTVEQIQEWVTKLRLDGKAEQAFQINSRSMEHLRRDGGKPNCRNSLQSKPCAKDPCPFAHPNGIFPKKNTRARGNPKRGGKVCFSFRDTGSCNTPGCPYTHSKAHSVRLASEEEKKPAWRCEICSGSHKTKNCRRKKMLNDSSVVRFAIDAGVLPPTDQVNLSINHTLLAPRDDQKVEQVWDSGASTSLTSSRKALRNFRPGSDKLFASASKGKPVPATGIGRFNMPRNSSMEAVEVQFVPAFAPGVSLLSTSQVDTVHRYSTFFCDGKGYILDADPDELKAAIHATGAVTKLSATLRDSGLYVTDPSVEGISPGDYPSGTPTPVLSSAYLVCRGEGGMIGANVFLTNVHPPLIKLMHHRMGHTSVPSLVKAIRDGHLQGASLKDVQASVRNFPHFHGCGCDACAMGKHKRLPRPKHAVRATAYGERAGADLSIPNVPSINIRGRGRLTCYVVIVDDHTCEGTVKCLRTKDEAVGAVKAYMLRIENQTGRKLTVLRTDNESFWVGNDFKAFLQTQGTLHETSTRNRSHQDGLPESRIGLLDTMTRTAFAHAGAPPGLWPYCVHYQNSIVNCLPKSAPHMHGMSPMEKSTGQIPDFRDFLTWGCLIWPLRDGQPKWGLRSHPCCFLCLGSDSPEEKTHQKNVIAWDFRAGKTIGTNDYWTNEMVFPWRDAQATGSIPDYELSRPPRPSVPLHSITRNWSTPIDVEGGDVIIPQSPTQLPQSSPTQQSSPNSAPDPDVMRDPSLMHSESKTSVEQTIVPPERADAPPPRRSARKIKPVVKLNLLTRSTTQNRLPELTAVKLNRPLPTSYADALNHPDAADHVPSYHKEVSGLFAHSVFSDPCKLPKGFKITPCKAFWKWKGIMSKCRYVIKGCAQIFGVNYFETFAPTMMMVTFRVLLMLAAYFGVPLHHWDVSQAFTNPEIEPDAEIYVSQPPGYEHPDYPEHYVLRLLKALYGTKQAARLWFNMLVDGLLSTGFTQCQVDPCIFVMTRGKKLPFFCGVFVDDLFPLCDDPTLRDQVFAKLEAKWKMHNYGVLTHCLGIDFTQDVASGVFTMSQEKYMEKIFDEVPELKSKRFDNAYTPGEHVLTASQSPSTDEERKFMESRTTRYRRGVGMLSYMEKQTRPDMTRRVRVLQQFLANPGPAHWNAFLRLARFGYLTKDSRITYSVGGSQSQPIPTLKCWVDADWAASVDDRKSITGYILFLGGGPVCWFSRKQSVVASSSSHAEYIAIHTASCDVLYLRKLLTELGFPQQEATVVYEDNQSVLSWLKGEGAHSAKKHIAIKWHRVRDLVQDGTMTVIKVSTNNQVADPLTKSTLSRHILDIFRPALLGPFHGW